MHAAPEMQVLVSHDFRLISQVAQEIYEVNKVRAPSDRASVLFTWSCSVLMRDHGLLRRVCIGLKATFLRLKSICEKRTLLLQTNSVSVASQ